MFEKMPERLTELVETAREDLRVKSPEQLKNMLADDRTGLVAEELDKRGQ